MKKIPSVFKRDYEGTRRVYDEVVPGCEWVLRGEGEGTAKWDGTCCMVRDGALYKRRDRKPTKAARKAGKPYSVDGFRPAPEGWEAAEEEPNLHTGHWPGWMPVGEGPDDRWHREAFVEPLPDGTYELCGPRVNGNRHGLNKHLLIRHGEEVVATGSLLAFVSIWRLLSGLRHEGIVWRHPDGRMAKIKRADFGLPWPLEASDA